MEPGTNHFFWVNLDNLTTDDKALLSLEHYCNFHKRVTRQFSITSTDRNLFFSCSDLTQLSFICYYDVLIKISSRHSAFSKTPDYLTPDYLTLIIVPLLTNVLWKTKIVHLRSKWAELSQIYIWAGHEIEQKTVVWKC